MRPLSVMFLLLLAACESKEPPATEVFPVGACTYSKTGKVGTRTWTECRLVGKNSCGNQIKHVVPTEEFSIVCTRAVWPDQKP